MDVIDVPRGYRSMASLWHGYSDEQVINVWNKQNWRERLSQALIEIAECKYYASDSRLKAMQLLNSAIVSGLLPEDWQIPERCGRVMLAIAGGETRRWWHALFWQDNSRQRLEAVSWFLHTASNFISKDDVKSNQVLVS